MRKYFYIYKSEVLSNLQYIFNIMLGFISLFLFLFVFLQLWNYIYDEPNQIINGYSKNQMIWYVTVTEILWAMLGGRSLCKKISNDVKSGNITYNINKPYHYVLYALFQHLGDVTIKGIIYTILGILTGFIFLGEMPDLSILSVVMVVVSCILATVINSLFIIFIGLFSFIIEDSYPFYWLYSKIILIIGTVFPIEYFPSFIQSILRYSPIYVVSYGPARMFVNFNGFEGIRILGVQVIYVFIAYILCYFVYQKGVRKLNVNGG